MTISQILAELDADDRSRVLMVYATTTSYAKPHDPDNAIEAWADVREFIKVVAVLDSPLRGWTSGGWTRPYVVWRHALLVEHLDGSHETTPIFVGQEADHD